MDDTELELMITVVVGAETERDARHACQGLLDRVGGRIVECGDCSDEEPGCWSVTINRSGGTAGDGLGSVALSRSVRTFMHELGPEFAAQRVACEPPTAWTVVDNPDLVESLVTGGERLLVEAWLGALALPVDSWSEEDPDEIEVVDEPALGDVDEDGNRRPRLGLVVDVVTERHAGAEWPARAIASRLSRAVVITGSTERPPVVRVSMDLGPAEGEPAEIVAGAVAALGGTGWSRPQERDGSAMARWSAAPTPPSGVSAVELVANSPHRAASAP